MTFTNEEEEILKLIAAESKANMKLNIENQIMGDEIRAEFKSIDERIRAEHKPIFTPLQEDLKAAQLAIKEKFN